MIQSVWSRLCHALNCALSGRRAAGRSQNLVREHVDNHKTVTESCFVYWYRWSHRAQGYLLQKQLSAVWKREKELGEFFFVFFPSVCVCTCLQDAYSLLGCLSRGTKSLTPISFPSVLTCPETGGNSDKKISLHRSSERPDPGKLNVVHSRRRISPQTVHSPGYHQPTLFKGTTENTWALTAFSVMEFSLKVGFH